MERKFLVLLRRFRLQNELFLFYHLSLYRVAHFSVFAARRGAYNAVCAKAQSNLIVLAPPALCAHIIPAVFRRYYKTAGIAPL